MRNAYTDGKPIFDRRHGPATEAAGDGQEGIYTGVLHTDISDGTCKVAIPALDLVRYRTANVAPYVTGSKGDACMVAFDQGKIPWVISAQSLVHDPNVLAIASPPRARSNTLSGTMVASTTVTITTGGWSLQNGMVVSGNGIKVPIAGYYRFDAQVTGANPSASAGFYQIAFSVNGGSANPVGTGTMALPTTSAFPTVTAFDELHMDADDVVTLVSEGNIGDPIHQGIFTVRYTGQ